ncbi:hypothetical protein ACFL4K_03520, partial [Candidatus Neomarinimicrobiota bacterium]
LKRWSVAHRWVQRRDMITDAWRQRLDYRRGLIGTEFLMELYLLRGKLLEEANSLPMTSGEGACFALAALERVIARILQQEAEKATAARFQPLMEHQLDKLQKLIMPHPPGGGVTPTDGDDDHEVTMK